MDVLVLFKKSVFTQSLCSPRVQQEASQVYHVGSKGLSKRTGLFQCCLCQPHPNQFHWSVPLFFFFICSQFCHTLKWKGWSVPLLSVLCSWAPFTILFLWDFPGGTVIRTPCFHCKAPSFHSWSGFPLVTHAAKECILYMYFKGVLLLKRKTFKPTDVDTNLLI